MTRELLNRLPVNVLDALKMWKCRYNDERFDTDIARAEIRGYLKGLRDSEIIKTDMEYRVLFSYCTV